MNHSMNRFRFDFTTPFVVGLAATALAACSGSPPAGIDESAVSVAGSYVAGAGDGVGSAVAGDFGALVFTADTASVSRDMITEGASIRLELREDGTTEGRLFVPDAAVPDGANDFEADLAGTWRVTGDVLRLRHAADTFLRDMEFDVQADRLVGDERFGGVRVRVELVRVP